MKYRPDIDGLRAVAVISVLLFHYDLIGGGFVGVDVFFVISGYLITQKIHSEMEAGKFTFSGFYAGRIRRLFPALAVTIVATFVASFFLLSPEHFERFGRSVFASLLSLSNVLFWQESGYFDVDSAFKPLLHTWSLSVEEQFYLFWPLLLFGVSRLGRRYLLPVLLSLCTISLLLNLAYANEPESIFYLIPFRVFELGIGATIVWAKPFRFGALPGLAMILIAVFAFTKETVFPSYNALLPCVGAALIINARGQHLTWLLSNRIAVWLGQISYSLYLVHWPAIVLYRYWKFEPVTLPEIALVAAASVVASSLLHYLVEQPFRRTHYRTSTYFAIASLAGFIIALPGANAAATSGWVWRPNIAYDANARAIEAQAHETFKSQCRIEDGLKGDCDLSKR